MYPSPFSCILLAAVLDSRAQHSLAKPLPTCLQPIRLPYPWLIDCSELEEFLHRSYLLTHEYSTVHGRTQNAADSIGIGVPNLAQPHFVPQIDHMEVITGNDISHDHHFYSPTNLSCFCVARNIFTILRLGTSVKSKMTLIERSPYSVPLRCSNI